jgi:hypothetical protein
MELPGGAPDSKLEKGPWPWPGPTTPGAEGYEAHADTERDGGDTFNVRSKPSIRIHDRQWKERRRSQKAVHQSTRNTNLVAIRELVERTGNMGLAYQGPRGNTGEGHIASLLCDTNFAQILFRLFDEHGRNSIKQLDWFAQLKEWTGVGTTFISTGFTNVFSRRGQVRPDPSSSRAGWTS